MECVVCYEEITDVNMHHPRDGVPDVLAIDRGNENCLSLEHVMWVHFWGELHDPLASRKPLVVLFSRSVHNTRVERVWVEFNVRFVHFINDYLSMRPAFLTNDNLYQVVRHVVFIRRTTMRCVVHR